MHADLFALQFQMIAEAQLLCRGLDYKGLLEDLERFGGPTPSANAVAQIACGKELVEAAKQFAERGDAAADELRKNPAFHAHAADCPDCASRLGQRAPDAELRAAAAAAARASRDLHRPGRLATAMFGNGPAFH